LSRIIGILLLLPILYGLAIVIASETGGEVVELETYDGRGTVYKTSLWIVRAYDDLWLRAGDPEAAWVQRLRETPNVVVIRDGKRQGYLGVVVPDFASRINAAMREKYGWADQVVSTLHDPDEVVAIRLEEP
jgi:hypothetical protein